MYVPPAFAEHRLPVLHDFIRRHDFASIVTAGDDGAPEASHVPVELLADRGRCGTLRTHLAQQNVHWKSLASGAPALAIFSGPQAYISPTWYQTTVAVPTWNYAVVHAHGTPRAMSDDELRAHLDVLVATYEQGRWTTGTLPNDVYDKLRQQIVGIEIEITRIEGKWKLGQNRTRADRLGAIRRLREDANPASRDVAAWMAAALEEAR